MSLNIAGSPRYLGCSTNNNNNNNPSISGAIKSYRMYNTNSSANCSVAEISSTNTINTNKDCTKLNRLSMDKTQIVQNPTTATIPEENGKNNDDATNNKNDIKLIMAKSEIKNCKISQSAVITRKKLRTLKVKEFNDSISCYLCQGYLINPNTIDSCIHSYCRSCIVKHLTKNKYCPQCGENTKEINLTNLKSDDTLKAVVYKLIPGLYQKEYDRHLQFNNDNKINDITESDEDEYFSPVEPISLSMEYHPISLEGSNSSNDISVPTIKYLQCPAAVTVHHLKRFICSKFGIDPTNDRIEIEIIYDDEILPDYFSLMDVGYTFNWKRLAPMKFYYQILVHNKSNEIDNTNCTKTTEQTIEANIKRISSSSSSQSSSGNVQKCVRFKDDVDMKKDLNEIQQNNNSGNITTTTTTTTKLKNNIIQIDNKNDKIKLLSSSNNNNDNHNNLEQERITNNNNDVVVKQNIINVKKEKIDKKQIVKVELTRNNLNNLKNKTNLELQQANAQNKNINNNNNNDENLKVSSSSSSSTSQNNNNNNTDFKSLRSNDVRYDFQSSLSTNNGNIKITNNTKNNITKTNNNNSQNKITNLDCEISQKPVSKCDIVVSIPQAHIHRASNSSDDSFENLSLAQLKTANKKGAVSPRENNNNNETIIKDIPKLKIDLPSLKTKFTMPKNSSLSSDMKKGSKSRKLSIEEPQPSTHEVDKTTYAKVIGLKPINPINPISDVKRDLNIIKNSPDASPVSSATSSSGSSSVFAFHAEISSTTTSHKKRKKGKHSKQSKDSKRRKYHAEISSQPADESLKFKVKLTGNHKLTKSERKLNDDSVQNSSIEIMKIVEENNDNKKKLVQINEIMENVTTTSKDQLSKIKTDNIQNKQIETISNPNNVNKNGINQRDVIPGKINNSNPGNTKIRTTASSTTINNNTNLPKYIPTSTIPPATSIPPIDGNSIKPSVVPLQNEILPKSLPQKLLNMQGPKLPVSPPLPPSLFKTTPMTIQTITATATKPPIQQQQQQQPQQQQLQPPPQQQLQPPPQQQLQQPRMPIHSDIRHQMHMQAIHRKGNRTTAANFIVPNPPRGIASSGSSYQTINSIASAAHRQAAQLKRSASLDSSPPTLTKQLKLEQDRLIRKAAYASMSLQSQSPSIRLPKINNYQQNNNNNISSVPITLNTPRRTSPPVSIGIIGGGNGNTPSLEKLYYTSTMGPIYTQQHENINRPILIPPSSVSVTKMTETFAPNLNHPSGLTITPQLQQTSNIIPFQFPQSNKPALEIVRISSNIPPADQQKLLVTNNNTIKQNIPKTTRPPPPQIPLVKIKRSMSQSQAIKPTITNVNTQSQIAQIMNNNNNLIDKKSIDDNKNNNVKSDSGIVGGPSQILDLSGKSSRSPSREKSNSPLSCPTTNSPKPIQQQMKDMKTNLSGNNLEAALSKLKQQQQQQNNSSYTKSLNTQIVNQKILNNNNNNNSNDDNKSKQTNDNSSNSLQNLQMLSESAINREKIIINTQQTQQQQQQRTLPKLPKLNEISKMRGNATVRQQNASIRNIPNPSALVFRNTQQIPMLASITKTSSPPKLNTISTSGSTVISDQKIIDSNTNKMMISSTTTTTTNSINKLGLTLTTSIIDPTKLMTSKKNLNIEQLAANLNMRAAAAADNTIKNTTTSDNTNNNIGKLLATSTTTTTTSSSPVTVIEQNNIIVSSNSNNSTTTYATTIPLAVTSTLSSTTSPVTVSSSLNNV